ncbi:hypothetical protein [Saccharopolyspora sp. NPDC002578]
MPEAGDVGRNVAKDISDERRELVDLLKRLCGHLGAGRKQTQREIVARLARQHGYPTDDTKLSKMLNGRLFPEYALVKALHALACEDASPGAVGITAEGLGRLYSRAEDSRCRVCAGHLRRVRELEEQAKFCREFHVDVGSAQSAREAFVQLPVPVSAGDRQPSEFAPVVDALTELAAGALADGRHEDTLLLIGEIVERLDVQDVAACVVAFRGRAAHCLADTLLQLYGREQAERQVMRLALQLQEAGRITDAGAAMRASVR